MDDNDNDGEHHNRRTPEEVFRDFKARRSAIITALTSEADIFYELCSPEKQNLCLFGYPNEEWEVSIPAEEVPPDLPEPALGINFARDAMQEKDWLALIAIHSDAWLIAVAFYFGGRFGFDKANRKRLFDMINDLPTVFEVVITDIAKKQLREMSEVLNHCNAKANSNAKGLGSESIGENSKVQGKDDDDFEELEQEDDDQDQGDTLCGACGQIYASDEFWIFCDICEKWFHGKCVKITPARAKRIKQYKCPSCNSNKGARA